MAVTLAQLRTRIRNEINKPSTQYDTFIDDAIRSAIRFYSGERFWFLEETTTLTLASGNSSTALPTNFGLHRKLRVKVNNIWRTHGKGFDHITFDELKDEFTDASATGAPTNWATFGAAIYVDKAADSNYEMDIAYIKKDTSLPDADGETSVWFEDGQDLIREKAMEFVYRDRLHAYEKANEHETKAATWLNTLTTQHNQRQITAGLLR